LANRIALGKIVLDAGADRDDVRQALLDVPGIGPWTADYVLMRGLGDPDVFLDADLGVRQALAELGSSVAVAEQWRPWRSYAVHHLWSALPPTTQLKELT
jgi:AraC family transcriptional regulator, regulatory protein of adaptative response / DNA-3-methyladenine glycosylase II